MGFRRKYTEVNSDYNKDVLYTFDSDFVLELMRLEIIVSIPIVMQIEKYVDDNHNYSPEDVLELAGVIKHLTPFYFVVVLSHYEDMVFQGLYEISSDEYLDYYNKNQILIKA
tara:strand:+ start:4044 stop:4379 length:336 start_codon:yes stop_codon:yes gene_type:complete